jgi:hypothetical protein
MGAALHLQSVHTGRRRRPSPQLLRPGSQGAVKEAAAWGDARVERRRPLEPLALRAIFSAMGLRSVLGAAAFAADVPKLLIGPVPRFEGVGGSSGLARPSRGPRKSPSAFRRGAKPAAHRRGDDCQRGRRSGSVACGRRHCPL